MSVTVSISILWKSKLINYLRHLPEKYFKVHAINKLSRFEFKGKFAKCMGNLRNYCKRWAINTTV